MRQEDKQRLARSQPADLAALCEVRKGMVNSLISARGPHDPEPTKTVYGAHATIFMENDDAERIYQVIEGGVMLYKLLPDGRRQIVELLGAGDVFGLVNTSVHGASAETLFDTTILSFDRKLVSRSPELSRSISHCIENQIVALHEHTMLLGRKSAIERVASFLMRLVPERGNHDCIGRSGPQDDAVVRLRMTRQEIADYLGLTIETVSRAFSELRRRGVIRIEKQDEVIINDVCRICHTTGAH